MANYHNEQIRSNRRLARQILGAVAMILTLIGLLTVIGWAVAAARSLLDNSDKYAEYEDRLYGMVMLDPLTFDDVNAVDPGVFKQAAIWGTVYQIQKDGGSLDQYERDADTGSAMIPKLEIDTYITNLLGPDYTLTDGSFETAEFNYLYDEVSQCYLVPVTSSVALYTPEVEKMWTEGSKMYVTVGYIPTSTTTASGELSLTAPTEPTKYMDYVFTRGSNRAWYLTGLQESETKVEATPTPSPTANTTQDTQSMVESQLDTTLNDTASTADSTAEDSTSTEEETAPAEDTAEDTEAVG